MKHNNKVLKTLKCYWNNFHFESELIYLLGTNYKASLANSYWNDLKSKFQCQIWEVSLAINFSKKPVSKARLMSPAWRIAHILCRAWRRKAPPRQPARPREEFIQAITQHPGQSQPAGRGPHGRSRSRAGRGRAPNGAAEAPVLFRFVRQP